MHEYDGGEPAGSTTDHIAQLVKLAGRRPMPDPAQMSAARAAAHEEWARLVQRRTWRAAFWTLTGSLLAASVVIVLVWSWLRPQGTTVPAHEIATLRTTSGGAVVVTRRNRPATVGEAGTTLMTGDRIETPAGSRAAFTLADGVAARLDENTVAVLDAADHLTLERGAVYVDSGATPRAHALHVETPFGLVRHLGTQFEVRLQNSMLRVRVREGSVAVQTPDALSSAQAGEEMLVVHGRSPERQGIATSGPEWSWLTPLAQSFTLEGASVPAFLQWVSREQGWHWEYDDVTMRNRVERIVLHGSIDGLTPEEALAAVLPTCGLAFRWEGDRLIVSAAQAREAS
jgi:hypothetical protein